MKNKFFYIAIYAGAQSAWRSHARMEIIMAMANYLHISTNSYQLDSIYQLEIVQEINEHSVLNLTALLNSEQKDTDIYSTTKDSRIEIYNELEKKYIFVGMIQKISIRNEQEIYYLDIHAVSATYLMDIKSESRSFQSKDTTYYDLLMKLMNFYRGGQVIVCPEAEQKIEKLMVQYNETDWEFLKRMASHFHKGLISNCGSKDPTIFFGEPEGTYRGTLENGSYTIKKQINEYMETINNGLPDAMEIDFVTFQLVGESAYEIGDYLDYRNICLYVKAVNAAFVSGELHYTYSLCTKNGLQKIKIYNEKIAGASIKGKVVDIEKDLVKVNLSIDSEAQKKAEMWWFPYSTGYTAEGNAGWYCMPEKGDTILIYFPSKKEWEAVGANGLRENREIEEISNPEIKYFRTANGKEIKFSPDEILITAANGKEGTISIRLSEKDGIEINSLGAISLTSDSNISINARKELKILADERIVMQCKSSKITMDSIIDIISKDVKIN